jgi:hypothetical protein
MIRCSSLLLLTLLLSGPGSAAPQLTYSSGQRLVPAFEGWESRPDGSFNLLFGYMNQNWDEEIDIPVGTENLLSPGQADQGQPTHFLPRRNRFVFKIRVPADFGTKELVWTLTSRGATVKAFGSLKPDYFLETTTLMSEKGGLGSGRNVPREVQANKPPVLAIEGDARLAAKAGEPLTLIAAVTDDGVPQPRAFSPATPSVSPPRSVTVNSAVGLRVSWYVYRGSGKVSFDPPQIKVWEDTREGANSPWAPRWTPPPLPPDGRILVTATFEQPGMYVLRCLADDGGLWDDKDVTVTVR